MITLTNDLSDNYNVFESLKIFVKLDDDVRSTYVALLAPPIGKTLHICAGFGDKILVRP
jgi:phage protein D